MSKTRHEYDGFDTFKALRPFAVGDEILPAGKWYWSDDDGEIWGPFDSEAEAAASGRTRNPTEADVAAEVASALEGAA